MDEFTGKANKIVNWAIGQTCTGEEPPAPPVVYSALSALQAANPDATFTCIDVAGKSQTVQCSFGEKTSTETGKKKSLLQWATSNACSDVVEPEPECKDISTLEGLNPDATFTCLACKLLFNYWPIIWG